MCLVKYEDYEEIFFLPPDRDVGVAVFVCLGSLLNTTTATMTKFGNLAWSTILSFFLSFFLFLSFLFFSYLFFSFFVCIS